MSDKCEYIFPYEEYPEFSRNLSKNYTKMELKNVFNSLFSKQVNLNRKHLNDIDKSTSSQGNSWNKAQSRNSMAGNKEQADSYKWAIEIYNFYPEKTKEYELLMSKSYER